MKNNYQLIRLTTLIITLSASIMNGKAQSDAATLIKAGTSDANALMGAYAGPMMKAFGAGLNSGWFQTAKPHGLGGFDITISANTTFAPSSDKSFDVNSLGLQKARVAPGESSIAPTVFGSNKNGPKMEVHDKSPITGNDTPITSFNMPPGLGTNLFLVPTAQLAVGVGFGTEVAVRFVPNLSVSDVSVGMIGFAVKHDFKQWIPVMKDLPFDLSAMYGYTSMNAKLKFSGDNKIQAEQGAYIYDPNPGKDYNDQKLEFKSKAWTANVLISKKLGPITPYLGLGYQRSKTDLDLTGEFPITVPNDVTSAANPLDPSFGKPARVMEVKDPVSVSGVYSGFKATAGVRLKLALITLHADYTFAQYNVLSAGIGVNLQSIVPFKL